MCVLGNMGSAATNMRVFVCKTDFTPRRLQRHGMSGMGRVEGEKTNAAGYEMQCAKCIFRDYTIEVINHNGAGKARGESFFLDGVRFRIRKREQKG